MISCQGAEESMGGRHRKRLGGELKWGEDGKGSGTGSLRTQGSQPNRSPDLGISGR